MAGTFVLVGGEELQQRLTATREKMANPQQFLAAVGELVVASVQRNFEQEGRPEKWRILSSATLEAQYVNRKTGQQKARMTKDARMTKGYQKFVGGKKILTHTARLRNSINARVEGDSVKVGTNLVYGAIHQFGGPCGRGRSVMMPARPYLLVQDEDWEEIREMGRKFFLAGDEA